MKNNIILRSAILVLLLLSVIILSCSCGMMENLRLFRSEANSSRNQQDDSSSTTIEQQLNVNPNTDNNADSSTQHDAAQSGTLAPDTAGDADNNGNINDSSENSSGETTQVVLYFVGADGVSLEAETRDIPKQEGLARATVNQLISGPQQDDLSASLPSSVSLRDINIRDGICTVDFSSELLTDSGSDVQQQLLALYSIVNTLTQFDSVDYVQILVNGQTISSSFGGVDASAALAPVSTL